MDSIRLAFLNQLNMPIAIQHYIFCFLLIFGACQQNQTHKSHALLFPAWQSQIQSVNHNLERHFHSPDYRLDSIGFETALQNSTSFELAHTLKDQDWNCPQEQLGACTDYRSQLWDLILSELSQRPDGPKICLQILRDPTFRIDGAFSLGIKQCIIQDSMNLIYLDSTDDSEKQLIDLIQKGIRSYI